MADNSEDSVEFRLGFVSDPDSQARLDALAVAVEKSQARMTASVKGFGETTEQTVRSLLAQVEQASQRVVRPTPQGRERGDQGGQGGQMDRIRGEAEQANRLLQERMELEERLSGVIRQRGEIESRAGSARITAEEQVMAAIGRRIEMEGQAAGSRESAEERARRVAEERAEIERRAAAWREATDQAAVEGAGERAKADERSANARTSAEARVDAIINQVKESWKEQEEARREASSATVEGAKAEEAAGLDRKAQQVQEEFRLKRLAIEARSKARVVEAAYQREMEAAEKASKAAARGRNRLLAGTESASEGIGKLMRAAILLGIAQEGASDKLIKSLAQVQAGIDVVAGVGRSVRGAIQIYEGFRTIVVATALAQQAGEAAAKLSTAATLANERALDAEARAAGRSAAALAARNKALSTGVGAAGRNAAASAASTGADAAGSFGRGALAAGAFKLVASAAVPAAIALGAVSVAAAEFRNATDGMTEAQRRAAKRPEDTGTFSDVFMSLGTAIGSNLRLVMGPTADSANNARDGLIELGSSLIIGAQRLASWTGAVDAFGDAATAEAERRAKIFQEQQAHLDRLRAIEIEGAKERRDIALRFEKMIADRQLASAESPQQRIDILQGRIPQADQRVSEARARVDALRDNRGNVSFQGSADEVAATEAAVAELNAALEDQQAINEELERSVKDRGEEERRNAQERRKQQAEELKGILDIIDAREKEIATAQSAIQTAEQRFATLEGRDQRKLIDALEKARSGDLTSQSSRQVELLERLGTEEASGFAQQIRSRQARDAGFDRFDLARNERQAEEEARRLRDEATRQFQEQTGKARADFDTEEERRQLKVNIEDLTTVEVKISESTEKLLDTIDDRITEAIRERDRRLQQESQARQEAREAKEREDTQKRIDAAENAD